MTNPLILKPQDMELDWFEIKKKNKRKQKKKQRGIIGYDFEENVILWDTL